MLEQLIPNLLSEYAQSAPPDGAFSPGLSLRGDLGIDSLSLVSLTLRLGDALAVEVIDQSLELAGLQTVADLFQLGRSLVQRNSSKGE
jgi:acyl carrier protein